ncbi:radical SAM/SPASM domain-containing protein [Streptomyces sp. CBMA152]|uniref:radical SAM/SPASM domain-containing protein n=1 Tax=Streptomyces sp. CBMA152 TaxID=1896312 RepID=UPI001661166E|nr:radical SAM/SPASM domain-containing protein [Streptomyces sp. CBMA152]MBD0744950.1 radical SAM protein [Streptomyces sp. CBMA152]
MATTAEPVATIPSFLELEITGRCQLTCSSHCYAEAGPTKGHGSMTGGDWMRVLAEAAVIGVEKVQLIGGEPTLHPQFAELVEHALCLGLGVEVYSNLYKVRLAHWKLFERDGVSLATSYYCVTDDGHDAVTGREGSHAATRANIAEALRRGITVRVGIVDVSDKQRVEEARAELEALGVTGVHIDRVRAVGNAAKILLPSASQLCGKCAHGTAAIMPDGTVTPCVLGRFLPAGSVKEKNLAEVFGGEGWARVKELIPPRQGCGCTPDEDSCMPSPGVDPCAPDCHPTNDSGCDPQTGGGACDPAK